jgi:hypothetical protein
MDFSDSWAPTDLDEERKRCKEENSKDNSEPVYPYRVGCVKAGHSLDAHFFLPL